MQHYRDEPDLNNDGVIMYFHGYSTLFNIKQKITCEWYKKCWNNGAILIFM